MTGEPAVTKAFLVECTRALWDDAVAIQPGEVWEAVELVFGRPVFVWDMASVEQLRALRRMLYRVTMTSG